MKTRIIAHTNGKGIWTDEQRMVEITSIEIGYKSTDYYPEDEFNGELRAFFDPSGFTPGSWNIPGHGLIYTDKLWMKEFKAGLRANGFSILAVRDLDYSEQGMQGDNYVSMDVGSKFYSSWMRLHNKQSAVQTV
jgi:hypothetical protein